MAETVQPTRHHPRWYRERVSTWWWMERPQYMKFVLREISSVFVAWTVVLTLMQISALKTGPEAYNEFVTCLSAPWMVLLNVISAFFVLFHAITWFNLAPRAMTVRVAGRRLPDAAISVPNFLMWAAFSAAIAWIVLR